MVHYIGIDTRRFYRSSVKLDGTTGTFESVIGVAAITNNFEKFDESYVDAIDYAFKKAGINVDYKYYCSHDLSKLKKKNIIEDAFIEKISHALDAVTVFYTLFSPQQLSDVKVYGRMSKRLKRALSSPIMDYRELLSKHLTQCFPVICAWKLAAFYQPMTAQFHLDSYEGHINEAQEEFDQANLSRFIYPHGDCSNPLISTADLLVSSLDRRLLAAKKTLIFENIRPAFPEFAMLGEKFRAFPILNQHLPKITPLDKVPIDTSPHLKHPVFWVFKNDPMIALEFIKESEPYRKLIDLAASAGGVVKAFDKRTDYNYLQAGDRGVYFNSSGLETIQSFRKFGKNLTPFKLDLMISK